MKVHHAEFCVHAANRERAADLWRQLGLTFAEVVLDEVDGPEAIARRYGALVEYRQHRQVGSMVIDEVQLAPVHGLPITFLAVVAAD